MDIVPGAWSAGPMTEDGRDKQEGATGRDAAWASPPPLAGGQRPKDSQFSGSQGGRDAQTQQQQ
jgi:hypothetical protein